MGASASIPTCWYNLLADLPFELPPDLPCPSDERPRRVKIPPALIRQELDRRRLIPIPEEVSDRYQQWRPTPLRRARDFERAIGTDCAIYYKYEGGNLSGSHKLTTAVAQAYFYRNAGASCLTVGTGAGQWGTAVAAACGMFGLGCMVYMVRSSYEAKPYRKTMMELLGATVVPSPSDRTVIGRRALATGEVDGTLSLALAEALEDSTDPGTCFATGSGETYTLLHQTVMGLEAAEQLEAIDARVDVIVAALGAGSNLAGLAFPFLGPAFAGARAVRVVSVEPAACPKLTRGRYAYDFTDASGQTPLQKMYTLGHDFAPAAMHAGGLRYHGSAKLIGALRHRGLIDALAVHQTAAFSSAVEFTKAEGILPAPESAHAIRGAVLEAQRADEAGAPQTIVISVSGHGLLDLAAYESYGQGTMVDTTVSSGDIERALANLPDVSGLAGGGVDGS